ncbi:hypothetical protein PFICI_05057 [Pestalotiopsis fici W106-1]|uniref:Uncharacterized protein n=1 Tax=Pestalotiopsis fici (strain W106-1 / CGMCC3.15140) TaxID=1229662 RepID=W3XDC4_PESFW|nr:uncharacterized protein PFICI_05057 [Pestalotiopsis fici W106-1]ETS83181.1 hypothetical protein PFICI_05057 [Pestalotiopsis fici W106-1]
MASRTSRSKSGSAHQGKVLSRRDPVPLGKSRLQTQSANAQTAQTRIGITSYRTKSEGPASLHESVQTPGRDTSGPLRVRANTKRRRSVTANLEQASQIRNSSRSPLRSSARLAFPSYGGHGNKDLSRETDAKGHPFNERVRISAREDAPQREPSRGRRRFRSPTPFPIVQGTQVVAAIQEIPVSGHERTRPHSGRPTEKPHDAEQPIGHNIDKTTVPRARAKTQDSKRNAWRAVKGGFLVSRNVQAENYLFPIRKGKPDPVWRAGDGFSDEEAAPDFLFYVTGQKKRMKPASTTDFGVLPLLPAMDEHPGSIRHSRKRRKVGESSLIDRAALLRGVANEPWPTYKNFMESSLPARTQQSLIQDHAAVRTHLSNQVQSSLEKATPKPQSTYQLLARYGKSPLHFKGRVNTDRPDARGAYIPQSLPTRPLSLSGSAGDNGRESSISSDQDSQSSIVPKTEPSLSGSDEGTQSDRTDTSDQSDQTIRSFWAADGSHFYPEDNLVQRGVASHFSNGDDDDDEDY